jgi:hypothetical protein
MLRFGVHGSGGLKILHFVCTIFGFWIPLRPLSGKRKYVIKIFSSILNLAFLCQSIFSLHMVFCFTVDSYITGVIYAVNIITVLKHLFCLVYFQIYKSQLAQIYLEIQVNEYIIYIINMDQTMVLYISIDGFTKVDDCTHSYKTF